MADNMEIEFSFTGDNAPLTTNDVVNQQRPYQPPQPQPPPQQQIAAAPKQPPPPQAVKPPAVKKPAVAEVDYSFLDGLANTRKTRKNQNKASNLMGAHDDLDLYDENTALAQAANQVGMRSTFLVMYRTQSHAACAARNVLSV